jgi:galactose-1-phosphate uridylyltransferase
VAGKAPSTITATPSLRVGAFASCERMESSLDIITRIKELMAAHRAFTETKQRLDTRFAELGMNFRLLHPSLRRVILREGVALGVEQAIENFYQIAELVEQVGTDLSDEEIGLLMLYGYQNREKLQRSRLAKDPEQR